MTQIFQSYSEFLDREDKNINGVSPEFAESYPNYEEHNEKNEGCWNCSRCSDCSDCSDCSRCSRCSDCSDCSGCSDCSDCSGCSDCSRCSDCSDCSGCSRCSGLQNAAPVQQLESVDAFPAIPVVENIHQAIAKAIEEGGKLNMESWHTCDTTHCRAGWAVHLAGEAGRKLESKTSTPFAALQIFKASSSIRVSPTRFYEDNKTALADIQRCAEEEAKLAKP